MIKAKPFERWIAEEVALTFGLKFQDSLPILDKWLEAEEIITPYERETLLLHHEDFTRKASFWNEDEIKFFFISRVITLVNFNKKSIYSTFTQRMLTAQVADVNQNILDLRGRVELVVAMGEQIPRQPFFFLNEYKPLSKTTPSDPAGQLLIAMIAARSLNKSSQPLYGVYVIGQLWYFIVLDGNNYAISRSLDAIREIDLFKIFSMLKQCKKYIEIEIEQLLLNSSPK